jgi:hypothetical protein
MVFYSHNCIAPSTIGVGLKSWNGRANVKARNEMAEVASCAEGVAKTSNGKPRGCDIVPMSLVTSAHLERSNRYRREGPGDGQLVKRSRPGVGYEVPRKVIFTDLHVISQTLHFLMNAFAEGFGVGRLVFVSGTILDSFLKTAGGVKSSKTVLLGKSDFQETPSALAKKTI